MTESPITVDFFAEPSFGENAYVVFRHSGGPCWIIDPGPPPSANWIIDQVARRDVTPDALILTHGHLDHIAGVPEVLARWPDLPVLIAQEAKAALTDPSENLSAEYGLGYRTNVTRTTDLPPGKPLTLDSVEWQVFDTSGHAPGSRSLYCPAAGLVIVGDALFAGSIGRTDFRHSHHETLIANIRTHLLTLPDETVVYSGHGPKTTIGREKRSNPFL